MSKQSKKAAKLRAVTEDGLPWMMWGLLGGTLVGAVFEVIYGISMFRMAAGAVVGMMLGALVDFIRNLRRKRIESVKNPQKRRGKTV
jgi:ABC-type branched-subunit amino acid transport system permease subunit